MIRLLFALFLFSLFLLPAGYCQQDSSGVRFSDFGGIIYLDSLVVTASRKGFDVDDFVSMVREDETFYQAFRNLRFHSYSADNDIRMYGKKEDEKAHYQSIIRQTAADLCRSMTTEQESADGNFYKRKKEYRYYTAKLFDRLFFTHQPTCETTKIHRQESNLKGMDKHVQELKKLIFQPGSPADIPFIGDRTSIFDPDMMEYYDFRIQSRNYGEGRDCYVFTAQVKKEFQERKEGRTVIKFLETYFEKTNFQVVARNYQLAYQGAFFDFDVTMKIELSQLSEDYVPSFISYDGFWNVPGKKPEIAQFFIRFYDFE